MARPATGTRSAAEGPERDRGPQVGRTARGAGGPIQDGAAAIRPGAAVGDRQTRGDLPGLLIRPQSLGRAAQVAVGILCIAAIALMGTAEVVASPTVTVGGFLILVVLAVNWLLPEWAALLLTAEAMAVPLVATRLGSEGSIAAELKVVAMVLMAITVRIAVRAVQRSDALVQARTRELVEANASLQRFTADAAHEFRAPLAFITSEIDVALATARDSEEFRSHLRTIGDEVARMAQFTASLLTLAQADAGTLAGGLRTVDLADLLEAAVSRWQGEAARRGLRLEAGIPDEGTVRGDPDLLGRVVDNLLDNALQHAATVVSLTARAGDGTWEITVSDDGPGVPPAQRERIFERFARGERHGRPRAGGAGLGLALSRAIVEAHGGSLRLRDSARGATFSVELAAGLHSASLQD